MTKPAPYPPETRAKGWRFEVNMEQVEQSDTWLRARNGITRGALLLLWHKAWMQTPCGTLPNDDELIALLLDMEDDEFQARKKILLRGWWLADDGRLYHDTITARVLEMMDRRRSESDRKARNRARNPAAVPEEKPDVPRDTTGTPAGLHPESATGTGTGTSNTPIPPIGGMPPLFVPPSLFPDDPAPPAPPPPPLPPAKPDRKAKVDEVLDVQPDAIAAWLQVRTKKRAGPINSIVLAGLDRERAKVGLTRQEAVETCVELGWQAFTAEWYQQRNGGRASKGIAHRGLDDKNFHEGIDHDGNIL